MIKKKAGPESPVKKEDKASAEPGLVPPPKKTKKGGHEPITNKSPWTKEVRLFHSCLVHTVELLEVPGACHEEGNRADVRCRELFSYLSRLLLESVSLELMACAPPCPFVSDRRIRF